MDKRLERMLRANMLRIDRHGLMHVRGLGPRLTRRQFGSTLAAASAGMVLSRAHPSQAATQVNYMGWQGYDDPFKAGDFLAKNGIELNITYQNDNNHAITVATGGGIGNMDIVTPDYAYTPFMVAIDMLQPIDMARVPNYEGLFDRFKAMEGPRVNGQQYLLPLSWGSIPLMYNPKFVTEAPTSWFDLLKPEYKGKVALTNDVISVMVAFALAATGSKTPTRITHEELAATIDLIVRIKKEHARTIASGYGELADLFASGEVWMAQSWEPVAAWAADKGVELKWVIPKEGTHTLTDGLSIVRDAPHLDEVYLLLNQGMSPEGQAYMANVNAVAVTNKNAVPLLDENRRKMYPYDDIDAFFSSSGGGPFPLWPIEPEGDLATQDDVLNGWEAFLKA